MAMSTVDRTGTESRSRNGRHLAVEDDGGWAGSAARQ